MNLDGGVVDVHTGHSCPDLKHVVVEVGVLGGCQSIFCCSLFYIKALAQHALEGSLSIPCLGAKVYLWYSDCLPCSLP